MWMEGEQHAVDTHAGGISFTPLAHPRPMGRMLTVTGHMMKAKSCTYENCNVTQPPNVLSLFKFLPLQVPSATPTGATAFAQRACMTCRTKSGVDCRDESDTTVGSWVPSSVWEVTMTASAKTVQRCPRVVAYGLIVKE